MKFGLNIHLMQLKISINIRGVYNMKDSSNIRLTIIKGKHLFPLLSLSVVGDCQYQNEIFKKI